MKVSVIIPTRKRHILLEKSIKSIEAQTERPEEVVIVYHKDDLKTQKYIKKLNTDLNIFSFGTDGGSCKGRNLGIKNANGDVLVFIDDDSILEMNYIKKLKRIFKNRKIHVLVGYTFDIVDLTTPWLTKRSEIEYIIKNKNNPFFKLIITEINKRSKSNLICNRLTLLKNSFLRNLRLLAKTFFLLEWPEKGKILASGWRSEMPEIKDIHELKNVEWFWANNFAIKKKIVEEYQFNEDIEIHPYALGEDLELSARIGKKYKIYLSKDLMVLHLRSPEGIRVNNRQKYKSLILTFYRISNIKGNNIALWWSIICLLIIQVIIMPLSYKAAIENFKGIIDGIKYMENTNV